MNFRKVFTLLLLFFFFYSKVSLGGGIAFRELDLIKVITSYKAEEKFFPVHKESLLLNLDPMNLNNNQRRYESIIGSFNTKSEKDIRFLDISKIPEVGIKKGDKISFYDGVSKKVQEHEVKDKSAFIMMRNIYYPDVGSYYGTFNLILTNPNNFHQFDHMDTYKFESVAYKGSRYKIKQGNDQFSSDVIDIKTAESQKLLVAFSQFKGLELEENSLRMVKQVLRDKTIVTLYSKGAVMANFYKTGESNYLVWSDPAIGRINFYSDFIEDAEFTAIYEANLRNYLIIFFKNRVETYEISINSWVI